MKKRTKRTFSLHHWCGLIAGIFLLAISVSGALLVFHDDIDRTFYAKYYSVSQPANSLNLDSSFEKVRLPNPGWEVRIPELPTHPHAALKYELRQKMLRKWIFAHPETGEILHVFDRADNRVTQLMLELHYTLFAGIFGKIVVLLCGLAFLMLTVTGFILYRKSLLKVITFRQQISLKNRRTFYSSLHRVIGVWSLVFNLLMGITGTWLAYGVVENALKKKNTAIETPAIPISIDGVLAKVKKENPEFEVTYLRFPAKADGTLNLLGRHQTDPAVFGNLYSSVQVNYTSGEIEKTELLKEKSWNAQLSKILHVLHFGDFAGLWVKILYSFFGIMPGILAVSGFVIWYFRRNPRPKMKRKQQLAPVR